MKGLSNFMRFDWPAFANDKVFRVVGISEWVDFDSKEHIGTKIDCVIAADKTPYAFKEGQEFTNLWEKITFKVNKDLRIEMNSKVIPKDVTATVYGEFRNQLSVKCQDVVVSQDK